MFEGWKYLLASMAWWLMLSSCSSSHWQNYVSFYAKPKLTKNFFTTADGQKFSYQSFNADLTTPPEKVIIALHGFCGADKDYENLGNYLTTAHPNIALYAYNIRGQGLDPVPERRGDIENTHNWFYDLNTFTQLIRKKHPQAKIIWQGESMGALIISHTFQTDITWNGKAPCDALILTSPVVKIRDDFPQWKKQMLKEIAKAFPTARLSLEQISGGQQVQMTEGSTHNTQAQSTPWNVNWHTLRLLAGMGNLIETMPLAARSFNVPTLVVHGGQDYFCNESEVKKFYQQIRSGRKNRFFYPAAHHLLMYDAQKDAVIYDIADWVKKI